MQGSLIRLVVGSLLASTLALTGDRESLTKEFLAYLKNAGVNYTVLRQTGDTLELKVPGTDKTAVALENFELNLAQARSMGMSADEAKQSVFGRYAATLRAKAEAGTPLRIETDGKRIRPRLISPSYLAQFPFEVLHEPLPNTGLEKAWVLDSRGFERCVWLQVILRFGSRSSSARPATSSSSLAPGGRRRAEHFQGLQQ